MCVTDGRVPFFTSDPWPGYPAALLHAYGECGISPSARASADGPPPRDAGPHRTCCMPKGSSDVKKDGVVEVTRKIVWGNADEYPGALARSPTSTTINTRFVERDNLAWREHNRRLSRKTTAFSKELPWMEKQLLGRRWPTPISACPTSACVRNCPHRHRPGVTDHLADGGPSPRPWQWA